MRLETPRLVLRDFHEPDLVAALPPSSAGADVPVQPFDLRAPDAVRAQVREAIATSKEEPRLTHDLAVTLKDGGRLIGRAGLRRSEAEPRESLFWYVSDPGSWNQGFLGEATQALFGWAFGELGIHRLYGECDPFAEGAVKLLEQLGLRREAHFVENAWRDGKWHDTAVYALLAREWKARPRP